MGTGRTYPDDLGARVRAARCYAGRSLPQLAKLIGISRNKLIELETSGRLTQRGRVNDELRETVLHAIIRHSEPLPYAFFTVAWSELPTIDSHEAIAGLTAASDREAPAGGTSPAPEQRERRRGDRQG